MGDRDAANGTGAKDASSLAASSLANGEMLVGTPYRIVRPLGSGAMGEVYEARHETLGERRALKVLGARHGGHREMIERIRAEARSLSQMRHPNLVAAVDLGIAENGRWYFAMELLEGETLRERVAARGPLGPRDATRILRAALDGLGAAHAAGIVHRDVKPENVFVCDDGTVKVLDFGIAKFLEPGAVPLTQSGMTVGTPRYMAPEQVEGRPVDARTDVYAAGIVLYEILSGNAPFEDDDVLALAYAHVSRAPVSLRERSSGRISSGLDAIVMRALEKNPKDRFESAATFRDALAAIESSLPADAASDANAASLVAARAALPTDPIRIRADGPQSRSRPRSVLPWAIFGTVLALGLVVFWFAAGRFESRAPARPRASEEVAAPAVDRALPPRVDLPAPRAEEQRHEAPGAPTTSAPASAPEAARASSPNGVPSVHAAHGATDSAKAVRPKSGL